MVMTMEFDGMSLVVVAMPPLVVLSDGFATMGRILTAQYHNKATEDGSSGDSHIDPDPEVIAGSFHGVTPMFDEERD